MRLDFSKLDGINNEQEMIDAFKTQINQADIDDQPFLSDVLAWHDNRRTAAMIAIHEVDEEDAHVRRWRVKVRCGEFGKLPVKGDTVDFIVDINRISRDGKLTSSEEINTAKINGSYATKYEKRRSYTIDEKGCILCPLDDAINFLRDYGVHSYTGYALPHLKPETSIEPAMCKDGQTRIIRYWRYEEVDNEQYEKLPLLNGATTGKKTRN